MEPWKPIDPPFEPHTEAPLPSDADLPPAAADPDFELLESYLDGELSPAERRRVERRLAAEPELSAALARMSAEYALRQAAFRSLEPDDRTADLLSESVVQSGRRLDPPAPRHPRRGTRSPWNDRALRIGRLTGALAGCVAISFCAGWIGRGYAAQAHATKTDPAVNSTNATNPADGAEPSVYQVALTDEAGNITAVQKFDNLEEAQSFAADVGRWQARQQQLRRSATATATPAPAPTSSGL